MTPTIASTLAALSDVGKASVTVRLNAQVYPLDTALRAAARHGDALSLTDAGVLTIREAGDASWRALREFTQDLLSAAVHTE